jgi:hypothetical protein
LGDIPGTRRPAWANTSKTTDVYFGRMVAATGAAAVLETLGYEKMPGEPMRVQPSRARRPTSEDD